MAIPYGYSMDGESRTIDQVSAAVVRRIFDEFTELYTHASLSEIAEGLNVDGIPTKRGGRWYASTVRYVLLNRTYAGADDWPLLVGASTFEAGRRALSGQDDNWFAALDYGTDF